MRARGRRHFQLLLLQSASLKSHHLCAVACGRARVCQCMCAQAVMDTQKHNQHMHHQLTFPKPAKLKQKHKHIFTHPHSHIHMHTSAHDPVHVVRLGPHDIDVRRPSSPEAPLPLAPPCAGGRALRRHASTHLCGVHGRGDGDAFVDVVVMPRYYVRECKLVCEVGVCERMCSVQVYICICSNYVVSSHKSACVCNPYNSCQCLCARCLPTEEKDEPLERAKHTYW